MKINTNLLFIILMLGVLMCTKKEEIKMSFSGAPHEVKLMTLDPGHFHAALVQKNQYNQVSPNVFVYAPEGEDALDHMKRIEGFNTRNDNPTIWETQVYIGDDYFEKMISEKPGNVMITSGNNMKKTEYIKATVDAGINVLADKPMCINKSDFELLLRSFESADKNNVLLYDIMTERSEITTIMQKELISIPEVFGNIIEGTTEKPAIVKHSVHHFFKYVSGKPLKRPAWFFDSSQQGDGLVDVTTHLVDLVQWELFPEQILDYKNDIEIIEAKKWPTKLTLQQFSAVTHLAKYPQFLNPWVNNDILNSYSNGEINYKLKGINAKVTVEWKYRAPEGGGDTHYSIVRGTKTNIIIKQGDEQNYKPELYIQSVSSDENNELDEKIVESISELEKKYPGLDVEKKNEYWHVLIPDKYRIGHEAHFGQVMERYLDYLVDGKIPDWEVPNMIAKYYTTTQALDQAVNKETRN